MQDLSNYTANSSQKFQHPSPPPSSGGEAWMIVLGVGILILLGSCANLSSSPGAGVVGIVIGVGVVLVSLALKDSSGTPARVQQHQEFIDLDHEREMEKMREQNRAMLEKARIETMGPMVDHELMKDLERFKHTLAAGEAHLNRVHQANESKLDREARLSGVEAKVQAEINLITARHQLENPSTEEEKTRKEFQFETTMHTLSRIAELSKADPTTAQMLLEKWQRGEV